MFFQWVLVNYETNILQVPKNISSSFNIIVAQRYDFTVYYYFFSNINEKCKWKATMYYVYLLSRGGIVWIDLEKNGPSCCLCCRFEIKMDFSTTLTQWKCLKNRIKVFNYFFCAFMCHFVVFCVHTILFFVPVFKIQKLLTMPR